MRLLLTALLIWCAMAIPLALAVGRMLTGAPGGTPPAPPDGRPQAANDFVLS